MQVLLISTYALGHQPFGLASPAAWLSAEGATVTCVDLSVTHLDLALVRSAGLIAFYLPMHTATRLASPYIRQVKKANPEAHLCGYGLYAATNARYLRLLGVDSCISGEFEGPLTQVYRQVAAGQPGLGTGSNGQSTISLDRQPFRRPDRSGLPPLTQYAHLDRGDGTLQTVGFTQASRGCKHHCRHCPIVPVYKGRFRIIPPDVVLADIRQQVDAGAEHITFGDPDFFNGPGHALPLVQALHREFPNLTYDVTIKIEHLVNHAAWLPVLHDTGCQFVTSAVESIDDKALARLAKNHTREDFLRAVKLCRESGIALHPTFVTFSPWTTPAGYWELVQLIGTLGLVNYVAPIQYAIRLLIPAGSHLLDLDDVQALVGPFDPVALIHPWAHPDRRVDALFEQVRTAVLDGLERGQSRQEIYNRVRGQAAAAAEVDQTRAQAMSHAHLTQPAPHLSEPWFC